jgi:chromosome segregation ATPase
MSASQETNKDKPKQKHFFSCLDKFEWMECREDSTTSLSSFIVRMSSLQQQLCVAEAKAEQLEKLVKKAFWKNDRLENANEEAQDELERAKAELEESPESEDCMEALADAEAAAAEVAEKWDEARDEQNALWAEAEAMEKTVKQLRASIEAVEVEEEQQPTVMMGGVTEARGAEKHGVVMA